MSGDEADLPQRRVLVAVLDRVRRTLPLSEFVRSTDDAERIVTVLGPVARADAKIDWIGVNDERVDAVVTAGESEWRIVFGSVSGTEIDWLDVYERPDRFDGVPGGRIVLLNGPSGSGKSTVMRAMQQTVRTPFVIFDEPEHIGTVQLQYLIWRDRAPALHQGYLAAIAALARTGNHVALSAAGHRQHEFVEAFGRVPLVSVGLRCDVEVLVERERRSGRWAGIAERSLGVHSGWTYDIEIDTTDGPDALEVARRILGEL